MNRLYAVFFYLLCLVWYSTAQAAIDFPKLSGRVVDRAEILDRAAATRIEKLFAAHQQATGNQLVVTTLADLQGYTIENFGYQLARHWGIGQQETNNGAILIVAKQERKVRIEVGYGLEGLLTDAISANIIHTVILPAFKRGQFGTGIEAGSQAMIEALGGQYKQRQSSGDKRSSPALFGVLMIVIVLMSLFGGGRRGGRYRRGLGYGGIGMGRGGFGGGRGGGFSGGGGGFGGGGASGGW